MIEAFLTAHGIAFERFDHPAVDTCEEAERLIPHLPGTPTKNLFLKDRKGRRHVLVAVGYEKSVDLQALAPLLQADRLVLASARRLQEHLGVEPGSVTLLGVLNDGERAVEVVLDRELWEAPSLRSHPLVNTATLVISREGMEAFFRATGHEPRVLEVPARPVP